MLLYGALGSSSSQMNVDESAIPEDDRIPRFTSASWKYENGALGHLEHGVALQGTTFSTEFTVCEDCPDSRAEGC